MVDMDQSLQVRKFKKFRFWAAQNIYILNRSKDFFILLTLFLHVLNSLYLTVHLKSGTWNKYHLVHCVLHMLPLSVKNKIQFSSFFPALLLPTYSGYFLGGNVTITFWVPWVSPIYGTYVAKPAITCNIWPFLGVW